VVGITADYTKQEGITGLVWQEIIQPVLQFFDKRILAIIGKRTQKVK
jgi:hypothetical protein